ncbi:hypothetical protein B0H14DRAFT_2568181 [Mycena olivaceomarginata]|nr:hypothetical protein B0H14DRAFT_2568181 [Mycena olivaceomarginata]
MSNKDGGWQDMSGVDHGLRGGGQQSMGAHAAGCVGPDLGAYGTTICGKMALHYGLRMARYCAGYFASLRVRVAPPHFRMSGAHKRKGGAKMLVGARAVNSISTSSVNTLRVRTHRTVVGAEVANTSTAATEVNYEEDPATQAACAALDDFSLGSWRCFSGPGARRRRERWNHSRCGTGKEFKFGELNCLDRPLQTWVAESVDKYVEEALRKEGRGSARVYARTQHTLLRNGMEGVLKRDRQLLRKLGLRVQLNHPPGVVCHMRKPAQHNFVLYDITGVHELAVDFCGCELKVDWNIQALRASWWPATLFQILNCLGKLSAYDFLRGLEMTTNHDGLDKPPDRRKPFMHIVRQWRLVKQLKRGRRGHATEGWRATPQGSLALPCRACPHPGWNLPDDWENIPPFYRFLYCLFLSQDANFRLNNRAVSSELVDPILGDGFGYFAKREGEDGYKSHIAKHVSEQEISSCSGFQAMFLANMKRVKGLRTTGIAGVTCARHNMWRANGMGDLQVGERYSNLDFLLLSALVTFTMWYICAFWERMQKFPEHMQLKISKDNVWWKVPNFHLPPHRPFCHSPFSFHYMFGAGRTHGEGVEQNWLFSNGAAASTKLMGPGARHATLEDIFGFHNYDRQLAMHRVLPKRLAENIKEGTKHKIALDAFTEGLKSTRSEEVAEWRAWVHRWEEKQHTDPNESPFDYKETGDAGMTLREIQVKIAKEELILTEDGGRGGTGEHSEYIYYDGAQSRGRIEEPVGDPEPSVREETNGIAQENPPIPPAAAGVHAGSAQLPVGSRAAELGDSGNRRKACAVGLPEVEARMREGEAREALEFVRQGLRSRTMTNRFRIRNYTGQGALTRGQGILRQINIKIHLGKIHYRYARAALLVLRGHGVWEEALRVLKDEDVRALNERAITAEEAATGEQLDNLARALGTPAGITVAEGLAAGEGSHTLSWIWYTVGATMDEDDPKLHEALRVEWCRAYARSHRFEEEIRLLREEMRRTIAYGRTAASEWDLLAGVELPNSTPEITEGRQAYAAEKAERERDTCKLLEKKWGRHSASLGAGEVMIELELGDELEPEDEEALLEGEDIMAVLYGIIVTCNEM